MKRIEKPRRAAAGSSMSRREFVQVLGAGLVIVVAPLSGVGQQARGRGGARAPPVAARIHVGKDGRITVLTGKIEMGQGARAELTQAAAEELRVSADRVDAILGDTALVPDDGLSAGSRTTPATVPAVRQGAAAARELLVTLACKQWKVQPADVEVVDGAITHPATRQRTTYADLAQTEELGPAFAQAIPANVTLMPVKQWKVMGTSVPRPNRRDLVTGAHRFPSDVMRPDMLYGKVLRPPSYGAKLTAVDLEPARAMKDVVVHQEGDFIGVAAPTTFRAREALLAVADTAKWEPAPHPSSKEIYDYLKQAVRDAKEMANPNAEALAKAAKSLRQEYRVAYVQHVPMETRSALAEWEGNKLTVWTSTQNPFGYQGELTRAFNLSGDRVRVIVPDFGCGFGGKHTGEVAEEAARLAKAAQRPVMLKWTREEEFTWAYFRPAAVIDVEAGLDAQGRLSSWHFININSGGSAVETPYRVPGVHCRFLGSKAPLRQGSYRGLAATANNFAREAFMDEMAAGAGADPLDFRLAHLDEGSRLRAVLEAAAQRFGWRTWKKEPDSETGIGLACGTEKGSYVAACVEIAVNRDEGRIKVQRVCEVFECGAVINPNNLRAQIEGAIIMGLGPALGEAMEFENGKMLNATLKKYPVPRIKDVPVLEIEVLNRLDLNSAGAGETPMIAVAPAIANALFQVTGVRVHEMPIRMKGAV